MVFTILVITKLPEYSCEVFNIRLWYLVNDKLIIEIKRSNNTRANNNKVNSDRIDSGKLSIRTRDINSLKDIGRLGIAKSIRVNIIINKSKTLILFNSYFNIVILLNITIYQL